MEAKKNLRGRRKRIEGDLTEEERKTRWKIEREAEMKRKESTSGLYEDVGGREDKDVG